MIRNVRNTLLPFITLALKFCLGLNNNVVIDLEKDCKTPINASAQSEGYPEKLSSSEYLNYVNATIMGDSDFIGVDLSDPSLQEKLNVSFHELANVTCRVLHDHDECSYDLIDINKANTIFLFNICERGFEFILSELSSAVPSQAPSFTPTPVPPLTVDINTTFHVHFTEETEAEVDEELNVTVTTNFETIVKDMISNETVLDCSLNHGSTTLVNNEIVVCPRRTQPEGSCWRYDFVTAVSFSGCDSGNVQDVLGGEIDNAVKNGDLQKLLCSSESTTKCSILIIIYDNPYNLGPIIGGAMGCAALLLVAASAARGKMRKTHGQDSHSDIEIAFPIPPLPLECDNPFEVEQDIPLNDENDSVFAASWSIDGKSSNDSVE